MAELIKINELTNPSEILLVIDAMMGQDAINVINGFNEEFASFLKYVRELSKMEFIICKCLF
jgi:signal recognition particle GTPase